MRALFQIAIAIPLAAGCLSAHGGWITVGGDAEFGWKRDQLNVIGIEITGDSTRSLAPANGLTFSALQGAFRRFTGGAASIDPAIIVRTGSDQHQISRIRPNANGHDLELVDAQGNAWFRMEYAHLHLDIVRGDLHGSQADLVVTPFAAAQAGSDAHAGLLAAVLDLYWPIAPMEDGAIEILPLGGCDAGFGPTIDVELTDMSSISLLAQEPGGRVAFAPSARLRNAGIYDIEWYWAIAPNWINGTNIGTHPFLVMHYYRELDGAFRQIGRSDVKHAWNTVNYVCGCPGGGSLNQIMYVGCEDVYGAGNNGEPRFFSPRDEVTAHTGQWTSLGSHFDGAPSDNFRDHGVQPDTDHDYFEHRLVVWEDDLLTTGATYQTEAWYIAARDTNIFNSMAHRLTTQAFTNNAWDFDFAEPTTQSGPALNAWVDPANPGPNALNRRIQSPDGHLQLAVRVSTNTPGVNHYEYALMNFDYDRQIEQFEIPLDPGTTITNAGFNDVDGNRANDWTTVISADSIRWTAPAGNTLDWGTLFNFRFDADSAPSTNMATLAAHEPGVGESLLTQTLAPATQIQTRFEAIGLAPGATTWNSVSGAVYRLESTPTPQLPATWTNTQSSVTAETATVILTDTNTIDTNRFYRAVLEQLPFGN